MPASLPIVILGRYPRPGRVKTRLLPLLGAEGCARLQEALLLDTVWRMSNLGPLVLQLAGGSPRERRRLAGRLPPGLEVRPQQGESLGERMLDAARQAGTRGQRGVVLLGTDAPTLPLEFVRQALSLVPERTFVFGPVTDGGYCLLGMPHPETALFEGIEWGSARVLEQSIERLGDRPVHLLPTWYDVDVAGDLARLAADLEADFEGYPRRTAALLRELRASGGNAGNASGGGDVKI